MASFTEVMYEHENPVRLYTETEFREAVKEALVAAHPFWSGVQRFLDWARDIFAERLKQMLMTAPEVSRWAIRISCTVTDFVFTVLTLFVNSLRIVFSAPGVWKLAHQASLKAWNDNEERGVLVQAYAYGKKMAAYFLEIAKQCLEKAIRAKGLELSPEEKDQISALLDTIGDAK